MKLLDRARASLPTLRTATPEEAHELRQLIALVLHSSPVEEHREALAIACADPEAALTCFRALVAAMQRDISD